MRLLFLDMDGVVNKGNDNGKPDRYPYDDKWSNPSQKYDLFYVDPELAARVSKLCEDYDLHIVSSSTWRKLFDINELSELLTARFLPGNRLIGATPRFDTPRADEIRYYIKNSTNAVDLYVILDDDYDAAYNSSIGRFFRTDFKQGYTEKVDHKVRRWLNSHITTPCS